MMRGDLKRKYIGTFVAVALLFLVLSIFIHLQGNYVIYRGIRGAICFTFLLLIIVFKKEAVDKIVAAFLLLYGTSSILTIWYEDAIMATLSMACNVLAFSVLIGALIPKINFKKMNPFFMIIFGLLVLVNAYLLYLFVEMIHDFVLGELHYFLILLGAMSMVVTGFLSLVYNHKFSSKSSLLFVIFICVLIFAEVFRAIGYYNFAYGDISVYVARALLLLGVSLIAYFDLTDKIPEERLAKK